MNINPSKQIQLAATKKLMYEYKGEFFDHEDLAIKLFENPLLITEMAAFGTVNVIPPLGFKVYTDNTSGKQIIEYYSIVPNFIYYSEEPFYTPRYENGPVKTFAELLQDKRTQAVYDKILDAVYSLPPDWEEMLKEEVQETETLHAHPAMVVEGDKVTFLYKQFYVNEKNKRGYIEKGAKVPFSDLEGLTLFDTETEAFDFQNPKYIHGSNHTTGGINTGCRTTTSSLTSRSRTPRGYKWPEDRFRFGTGPKPR